MPDHQTSPVGEDAERAAPELSADELWAIQGALRTAGKVALSRRVADVAAARRAAPTQPKAQIGSIDEILKGIDEQEVHSEHGWWETSGGAEFGAKKLAEVKAWAARHAGDPVPGGWKLVPIEPNEDLIVSGFESWPDRHFSEPAAWAAYEAMTGCQQAAHRARLCWDAMLGAAPAPDNAAQPLDRFAGHLTEAEINFVELVKSRPGQKLSWDEATADNKPLWRAPEALGMIKCIGSYKWVPSSRGDAKDGLEGGAS